VPGNGQALLLSGDSNSLAFDRAVAFQTSYVPPYGGQIGDFVVVDKGSAVVLSAFFQGGVAINGESHFFGSTTVGLALMKLKLY
jgi:hypothetical protein